MCVQDSPLTEATLAVRVCLFILCPFHYLKTLTLTHTRTHKHKRTHKQTQVEADLLSAVLVKSGRQAVALASGYVEPYSESRSRTQLIVVVTEGWDVLCFDSNLKLLWYAFVCLLVLLCFAFCFFAWSIILDAVCLNELKQRALWF